MSTMFRAFSMVNYRIWFLGGFLTNIGGWMQRTAQDWIVIAELGHNSVTSLGIVIGLQFVPALLLMPLTGYAADRFKRRHLIMATQFAMILLGLGLGVLTVSGVVQLWHVYLFALLLGVVSAFDIPARHAFVSDLVGDDSISNAVALNSVSFGAGRLIGPALAGILIAVVGSGWVFVISAVSFAAVVTSLLTLRTDKLFPIADVERGPGQIRQGFRYIRGLSSIMVLLVMIFLMGALGLNFAIFIASMARVEFDKGAPEFGLLSSALAVGSVAGALVMARWCPPGLRLVTISSAAFAMSCFLAAAMPSYWAFAASLIGIGFTAQMFMTSAGSTVQLTTRPAMRGRVLAIYMAVFVAGAPFGAPLVGWIGNELGPRWTLIVGGLAAVAACIVAIAWMFATRRLSFRLGSFRRLGLTRTPRPATLCVDRCGVKP